MACQPRGLRPDVTEPCFEDVPGPGEIAVGYSLCDAMSLAWGERQYGDLWLANSAFRAVVRHPSASLTRPGLDGGTLVDAAPWGRGDGLHEAIPLVGGGWLDIDRVDVLEDGVELGGTVASLPGRVAAAEGEPATVRWRIQPDTPWLEMEGADGLWLHAGGTYQIYDHWLWTDGLVYGHDGVLTEDLGGAVVAEGASRILISAPGDAMALKAGDDGVWVSGTAPAGRALQVARGEQIIGFLPIDGEGNFAGTIPADATAVRATVWGRRAPSGWVLPAADLSLSVGADAAFEVRPAWPTDRRAGLQIVWSTHDGRADITHLPSTGGALFMGKGDFHLTVSAGPTYWPVELDVEADSDFTEVVVAAMEERFDPGSRVLGILGLPVDRSVDWRGTDAFSANLGHGFGAGWLAFTPTDDVASATDEPSGFPPVPHVNGSLTLAEDRSWAIASWPWSLDYDRPGHGAVDARGLSAEDALAAARGGAEGKDRHTVVDLAWMRAVERAPWATDPVPEGVWLTAPGPLGPDAWSAWYPWLDAAVPVAPVGPLTWFDVADPTNVANQDVHQALTSGRTVATTGPLITLDAGGLGAGDVAPEEGVAPTIGIVVFGAADLDHVALLTDGGTRLAEWPLDGTADTWTSFQPLPEGAHWVVGAAWDDAGRAFAVTAPLWVDPP